MSINGVAEDPASLRSAASQLRREADVVATSARSTSQRVAAMAYAGPAAEQFRTGIATAGSNAEQIAARLLDLAAWLDTCAYQAEVEIAARRAAGLP